MSVQERYEQSWLDRRHMDVRAHIAQARDAQDAHDRRPGTQVSLLSLPPDNEAGGLEPPASPLSPGENIAPASAGAPLPLDGLNGLDTRSLPEPDTACLSDDGLPRPSGAPAEDPADPNSLAALWRVYDELCCVQPYDDVHAAKIADRLERLARIIAHREQAA